MHTKFFFQLFQIRRLQSISILISKTRYLCFYKRPNRKRKTFKNTLKKFIFTNLSFIGVNRW